MDNKRWHGKTMAVPPVACRWRPGQHGLRELGDNGMGNKTPPELFGCLRESAHAKRWWSGRLHLLRRGGFLLQGYWKYPVIPQVDAWKFLDSRRMTNICERWSKDHTNALQYSLFNGDPAARSMLHSLLEISNTRC